MEEVQAEKGSVYVLKNTTNDLLYVGETTLTLQERFKLHIGSAKSNNKRKQTSISKAIKSIGSDKFWIEELEVITSNDKHQLKERLWEKEVFWIKELNSRNHGYNETDGGKGAKGRIVSEETKTQLSESHMGELNPMFGTTWSEEKREQMRDRMIGPNNHNYGKPLAEETKKKLTKALTGRKMSEEAKQKISNYQKGQVRSEETKAKMSEAKKGQKLTEETKEKIKKTRKRGDDNPRSKAILQLSLDGEVIKRYGSMNEAAKAMNIFHTIISCICNRKKNKEVAAGYRFCFEEDLEETLERINKKVKL